MKDFVKNLIKDVAVDLSEEFDLNFHNKTFFDRPWEQRKMSNQPGSLMNRPGTGLRGSIEHPTIGEDSITWSSSLPYASIHNEGGEIMVTAKMKRYFWAMYYKAAGAVSRSVLLKDGTRHLFVSTDSKSKMAKQLKSTSQRAIRLNKEAEEWRNLALMKIGSKIKIPQRQFIGDHPRVQERIQVVFDKNMKEVEAYFNEHFKQK